MHDFTRRSLLQGGTALAATGALTGEALLNWAKAWAADSPWKPEAGAKLTLMRWKRFVPAEDEAFNAIVAAFKAATGTEFTVFSESFEDLQPKASVAANTGAGLDMVWGTHALPQLFPTKVVKMNDVADYLGKKYGGWSDGPARTVKSGDDWLGIPIATVGGYLTYRKSATDKAGFKDFPKDFPGFLEMCKALKANNTPAGFALGHATGDANGWCQWLLWAHGGKVVNEKNEVVIDSPETIAALEYVKELYPSFIPGVLSWNDSNNNKAFLAGEISLTLNGISIWTVGKNSPDPKQQEIAKDMDHAAAPVGPVGKPTEQQNVLVAYGYKYSKYPKAVKEYIRFMWEKENYDAWEVASNGYVAPPLPAYNDNPVWTSDPKITPFRDCLKRCLDNGYAGDLGNASAGVMGDFVVVDMFAEAASGSASPKEAAARAAERAKRYYQA